MNRLRVLTALTISILAPGSSGFSADNSMCKIADQALQEASSIRGLRLKRKVPCYVRDKEEVKKYLLSVLSEKIPTEKLEMEELVYKSLGFIPKDFDYKHGLIDLYLSQIGGYYDPDKDYFVMAAWMPAIVQTTIAVHEQTHALQDQYYALESFVQMESLTSDQLFARSALIEGDATAVMTDYMNHLLGQPKLAKAASVEGMMMQNVIGAGMLAAGQNVPQSLVSMMIFPYTSGLRFVHSLLQDGGYKKVDECFKKPPRTTEEILHPEKYISTDLEFRIPVDSELLEGENEKVLYSDVLGEFAISVLLRTVVSDGEKASRAAAGWGGDRVGVVEIASKERAVRWITLWDSEKDAVEFEETYQQALGKEKWFGGGWLNTSDGRQIKIVRDGTSVTLKFRS